MSYEISYIHFILRQISCLLFISNFLFYFYFFIRIESSRTSLASRTSSKTHFEVLGLGLEGQVLGLEVSSPRKLPCPRLDDSTIFCTAEILLENARNLAQNLRRPFLFLAVGDRLKNFIIIIIIKGQRCKRICYR